ncbi:MAG: preprotein translocase subunit SecG [Deltaproteobacteria bacterium]|jgi:preprotein translocase subunit SecG|nr:preprotein translocase subunit SecG [Deltaproteobacteria bacterium]
MISALTVLHVIVCLFLIAVVLLQRGKGAEMGAVFGGGASSTVFGSRGAGNFLTLLTKICATVFMLTSLSLSYLLTEQAGERLFDEEVETSEAAPFEDLGAVMPEEADAQAPQADPVDATGSGAALDEFIEEDANKPDSTP